MRHLVGQPFGNLSRLFAFVLFLVIPCTPVFSQCTCQNAPDEKPLEGGNGDPLYWHSSKSPFMPASNNSDAWFCFVRSVDNKSDRNVTDVFWKVAGFEKPVIGKKQSRCDATPLLGEEKPHPQGPLHYNIGPQSYDTAVYAPKGGFKGVGSVSEAKSTPDLGSTIEVSDPQSRWTGILSFRASVKRVGETNEFSYSVSTSAPVKLIVYWYIPLTEEFRALKVNRDTPITAIPHETAKVSVRSSDRVGWSPAAVQVFDYDNRWIATGMASVYCSIRGKAEALREQPQPKSITGRN